MQKVDRYMGQPLCFLASRFKRKRRPRPQRLDEAVIIKMFGMGTLILITPMVRALRQSCPGVRITFVTFAENRTVVSLYGLADRVCLIRKDTPWHFITDTLKTALILRWRRVSVVFDGEFFSRFTALLSFLIRPAFHAGFFSHDIYRGGFLDHRAYFNPYRHVTDSFMELVTPFVPESPTPPIAPPRLPVTIHADVEKKIGLSPRPIGSRPLVLFNPNVSDMSRHIDRSWPLERFAAFADHAGEAGFQPVFIGGPQDRERNLRAVGLCGNGALNLAGRTSIAETLTLMQRSFLLVTNDSGPLHMAVSVGLPTASFFGTESPMIYGHNHGLHKVFWKGLACSPCLSVFNFKRGKCDFDSQCLKEISAEEVIDWFESSRQVLWDNFRRRTGLEESA